MPLFNGNFGISQLLGCDLFIREAATSEKPASDHGQITLPKRKNLSVVFWFVYDDPSISESQALLKNSSANMECQLNGKGPWMSCPDGELIVEIPNVDSYYFVREKATNESFASQSQKVSIKTYRSQADCSLNIKSEAIAYIKDTMEYQINGEGYSPAGEMTVMPLTEIANSLTAGQNYIIDFRYKRTQSNPIGKVKRIVIYPRPDKPNTEKFIYNPNTFILSGVTTSMQYRKVGTNDWKDIYGSPISLQSLVNGDSNVQIEVRYKPQNGKFASHAATVNLY